MVGPLPLAMAAEADVEGGCGAGAAAAFLKLGSFGLGLGAEKKEESVFDSLSEALFVEVEVDDFGSFLTADLVDDDEAAEEEDAMACFFAGGPDFDASGSDFRFLAEYLGHIFNRIFGCLFVCFCFCVFGRWGSARNYKPRAAPCTIQTSQHSRNETSQDSHKDITKKGRQHSSAINQAEYDVQTRPKFAREQ